jgi:hypothetical protein
MRSALVAVGALAVGLLTLLAGFQPAGAQPGHGPGGHVHMAMGPHLGSGPHWGPGPRIGYAPRRFNNVASFHDHDHHHHHHHHGVFFVDAPLYAYGYGYDYYDYGYDCRSLRWRAVETGSAYWWHRYRDCVAYY